MLNVEKVSCDQVRIFSNYSEVQKVKNIYDRVRVVAKAQMRSWMVTGHNSLNVIDIKEGMKYTGGIRNTKVTVAEIIPDADMQSLGVKNFVLSHAVCKIIWIKQKCQMFPRFS